MDIAKIVNDFIQSLGIFNMIISLIFIVVGVLLVILARRITRIIRRNNEINDNDAIMLTFKIVGILFMFAALCIIVFKGLL